jgi:TPR repeat protein
MKKLLLITLLSIGLFASNHGQTNDPDLQLALQGKYTKALRGFEKRCEKNDAYACGMVAYFYNKGFGVEKNNKTALEYYKKAIESGKANMAYALYQTGICYGLLGKYNEKVITLAKLINDYENLPYIDDALFEQGNAYMQMQEPSMPSLPRTVTLLVPSPIR